MAGRLRSQCGLRHRAVSATLPKAVIKLIAPEPGQSEIQLSRWRAAPQPSHSNLIRIFATGQCKLDETPLLYVVMEQAEEDLSQILPQRALSPDEIRDLLPQLLDGLTYLHGKGFVHTRVRPSNVLAMGDQVKLSADQVTAIADTRSTRRRRDVYDAPETAAGILSPASDIWSLGVTLMAALTQNVPQNGEASHGDPGLPASIPEPFHGIVRECLHLDPRQRCTIAQIRARMQPAARSVPAPSPVPTTPSAARHSGIGWRILIALVVLLIFGFGVRYFHTLFSANKSSQSGPANIDVPVATQPSSPQPTKPSPTPVPPPRPSKAPVSSGGVVRQVLPEVSASARRTITGTIRINVRVEVNSSGKVTSAKLAAPVSSRYFSDHTLQAAKAWEFSPTEADGQPAPSAWMLQFRIQRSGTQASADRISR